MKFHHHGYVSDNPRTLPAAGVGVNRSPELPEQMDVLIVGSGPAAIVAAAQLSVFPDILSCMIDKRDGRLVLGHADGVQQRSVETFQAFGFADEIINEAYQITETAFWSPSPDEPGHIVRTRYTDDDPHDLSEFPHLIVNQARVLDYFREFMERQPSRSRPYWGLELIDLSIGEGEYPVEARLRRTAGERSGEELTVRTKYLIGGDGAHSRVRRAIGATHQGTVSYHAWGVVDMVADTDFPDIRTKSIISSRQGHILHIPREGGYLFRSYVDLGEVGADDNHKVRHTPLEEIIRRLNAIVAPYTVTPKEVAWWSVYEVGHRVTDRFDEVGLDPDESRQPHVFICGDACHTHSAKAGQGMNVSMQDSWNIGWKLAQVLRGYSSEKLLRTYNAERQQIAQDLISFDSEWSSRMSGQYSDDEPIEDFYVRTAEFPAGFMTQYPPSQIISSRAVQQAATGYPLGKRFKSHPAVRRCDATTLALGHQHVADGRWRVYVFADAAAPGEPGRVADFAQWWATDPSSPMVRHTRPGDDPDTLFDLVVVYRQHHREYDITDTPEAFRPRTGPFQVEDWNQVWSALPEDPVFQARGIADSGAVVVVRPDQYVADIQPLDGTAAISAFFDGVFDLTN
ncbi:FAD-dependent monooxygenase [Actinomyces sp. W5033]|uniref:FAD-dependent monooxygenase n=1 Tax=Actinomyces sp. W5033 TaxID=3446479 RepID=UPI003EDEDC4E